MKDGTLPAGGGGGEEPQPDDIELARLPTTQSSDEVRAYPYDISSGRSRGLARLYVQRRRLGRQLTTRLLLPLDVPPAGARRSAGPRPAAGTAARRGRQQRRPGGAALHLLALVRRCQVPRQRAALCSRLSRQPGLGGRTRGGVRGDGRAAAAAAAGAARAAGMWGGRGAPSPCARRLLLPALLWLTIPRCPTCCAVHCMSPVLARCWSGTATVSPTWIGRQTVPCCSPAPATAPPACGAPTPARSAAPSATRRARCAAAPSTPPTQTCCCWAPPRASCWCSTPAQVRVVVCVPRVGKPN